VGFRLRPAALHPGKIGNYLDLSLVGLIARKLFCRLDLRSDLDDNPEAA
jgi:hypothetical protein